MIGMTSCNLQWVRNTSYYGLQVVHCVRRLRRYRKSSKTTKYALRAVACLSTSAGLYIVYMLSKSAEQYSMHVTNVSDEY